MKLCITEKPSVGKDIARILGATAQHQGYYEGNGYRVSWTFGHLCCLKDPEDYTPAWKPWAISRLPMIPPRFGIKVIDQPGIVNQFGILERLIQEADEVINCGDAGQEGELIQRWVLQKAGCDKPIKRLWISSLTDDSIREGFENLRPQKDLDSLYTAGLCRAIGDWMLGINATRLYTLKYSRQRGQLLSVGRVQTPTLALVVNRQKELENFIPKDSWEIRTLYKGATFTSSLKPFASEQEALSRMESLKGSLFTVTDVQKKSGKEAPPRLFDLTSLQVEANKKFNLSADETLKTIQSLYEKKLTTYPRVDTTYLTDDVYPQCGRILNGMSDYQEIMMPLRGRKLRKSKKTFDNSKVTDHHAIIPTGMPLPHTLSSDERRVYDLVARRFIAVFFPDCSFEQTTVKGKAAGVDFKAGGKVISDPGWRTVFAKPTATTRLEDDNRGEKNEDNDKDDEPSGTLPSFTKGETGPHQPHIAKKTTQPPKYFTEGTLLKAMETAGAMVDDEVLREALKANGIGRPSTRAAIIEILYKRGYIVKERKSIRATQAGIDLISIIQEELLKSAKLTGIWEGRLRAIERGEYSAAQFIAQLKDMVTEITRCVMCDPSDRSVKAVELNPDKKSSSKKKKSSTSDNKVG